MSGPVPELVRRGLTALRRSAFWWGFATVAFAVLNMAFWPSFESSGSLTDLEDSMGDLLEAFGAQGLSTSAGYLDGQLYALMLPLLLSAMALIQVTGLTSGDEDAGRLELLHALPVRRRAIWLARYLAVVVVLAVVAAITAAVVGAALGPFSLDEVNVGSVVAATFACALLAAFHAAVGFLAGAAGCRRGLAAGIAVVVLVAGYILSYLVPLADGLAGARKWSPWYWALGEQPVSDGVSAGRLLVLGAVTAVLVIAGLVAIERRDIRPA